MKGSGEGRRGGRKEGRGEDTRGAQGKTEWRTRGEHRRRTEDEEEEGDQKINKNRLCLKILYETILCVLIKSYISNSY